MSETDKRVKKRYEVRFVGGNKLTIECENQPNQAGGVFIFTNGTAVTNDDEMVACFRSEALVGWRLLPDQSQ